MAKNYLGPGQTWTWTVTGAAVAGKVYVESGRYGVADAAGVTGDVIVMHAHGSWDVPKPQSATAVWAIHAPVYITSAHVIDAVSTSNTLIGHALEAAATSATGVKVILL